MKGIWSFNATEEVVGLIPTIADDVGMEFIVAFKAHWSFSTYDVFLEGTREQFLEVIDRLNQI